MEYRKSIPLDTGTDYWFVHMGELNRLNGAANYPFPTERAAFSFAETQKALALAIHGVHRDIEVRYPDGRIVQL